MRILTVLILVLFTTSVWGQTRYVCQVNEKMTCSENGCEKPRILDVDYRIIDEDKKLYSVISSLGSDEHELIARSMPGAFLIFNFTNSSYIKILQMDVPPMELKRGDFIESRDLGLTTVLSWGTCEF